MILPEELNPSFVRFLAGQSACKFISFQNENLEVCFSQPCTFSLFCHFCSVLPITSTLHLCTAFSKRYPCGLTCLSFFWFNGQRLSTNLDFSIDVLVEQEIFVSGCWGQHALPTEQVKVHLPLAYNRVKETKLHVYLGEMGGLRER